MGALLMPMAAMAASNAVVTPDGNSMLMVENAVGRGATTSILFWTYPGLGDPGAGSACPLNFYTMGLQRGLATARAEAVAIGVCGNPLTKAALLSTGEVLVITVNDLQRWGQGELQDRWAFSSLEATREVGFADASGAQRMDVNSAGDVVLAAPARDGSGWQIVSLDGHAKLRWRHFLAEPGQRLMLEQLWSSGDGSALLRVALLPADHSSIHSEEYLYFISAQGVRAERTQLSIDNQPDMQSLMAMAQANVQQALAQLGEGKAESIRKLDVALRESGGFDVLLQRSGGTEGRAGHFLLQFGRDGSLQAEQAVTDAIAPHGLENWKDFYVAGRKLVLLASVAASQPAVQARRTTWMQNVTGHIDLDSGALVSRLLPLDQRYLQEAMNTGDEGLQNLANWPGGEAVLLAQVSGIPVALARGKRAGRPALLLDEGTADLPMYTEAFEQGQSEAAREAAREKRRSEREAQRQQQASPNGEDFGAQMLAALAQAQQAGAQANMPPEVSAQIAAAMAQVQQQFPAAASAASPNEEAIFRFTVADAFELPGRGVALTGLVDSGAVKVGDSVCLVAAKIGARMLVVEGMEGRNLVDSAQAGERPAIIVNGIQKEEISPGDELRSSCQ